MRTRINVIGCVWFVAGVGACVLAAVPPAAAAPLTAADVEMVMAVRETADAARQTALTQAGKSPAGKERSFVQVMVEVQRIGQEADESACRQHGVPVGEYRQKLRRMVNVGELVALEQGRETLQAELRQRQSKGPAELGAEAERQRAATEEWFGRLQRRSAAEAGTKDVAVSADYVDSIEQTVMKPMRERMAGGDGAEVVRRANEQRIEEIEQQLRKVTAQLATAPMRQAAADTAVVLAALDSETLRGLRSSLVEDLPAELIGE